MYYAFPNITHISQMRAALKDRKEFIFADKGDYIVANYLVNLSDTFPEVSSEEMALRREARGILFCSKTGNVIARRLHKFFNLGERPETSFETVDFSKPHIVLEKLDGSMVTPFYIGDLDDICPEALRWGTKMGETDVSKPVLKWLERNQHYARYSAHVMSNNRTPIYEWCTRAQRIVVDYPVDRLVLTAIRHNTTGQYLPYEELIKARTHGIEVVDCLPNKITNVQEFVTMVRDLKGQEGFVVRFDDGHMVKLKAEEYLKIHRAKELISFEKDLWALILDNKIDDLLPLLEVDDRQRLIEFAGKLNSAILDKADKLKWEVIAWIDNHGDGQKKFAVEFVNAPNSKFLDMERGLLFRIKAGLNPITVVREYVRSQCSTNTNIDKVRPLVGNLKWDRYTVLEE